MSTRDERGLFIPSGLLDGVDLTQATADLLDLPGVTISMIRRARARAGVTEWAPRPKERKPRPAQRRRTLDGADLTRPYAELMDTYKVSRKTVYNARRAAGMEPRKAAPRPKREPRRSGLRAADLTRPTRELADEFKVTMSAVHRAREALGVPAPPRPRPVKTVKVPTPRRPVPAREIHVPAPPPMVAEDAIVDALRDELAVCRSAYSAALMVSSRLKRPMDELLPVAERLMGRAA